jgi:ferritin-like metal-binding protein YciE
MNLDSFRQMYVTELQELRSVEDQLTQALPRMADMAEHPELKEAIATHTDATRLQRDRLDQPSQRT